MGGEERSALLLKRYRIEAVLGEGGLGTVYKAYDAHLKRPVAIKTVKRSLAAHDPDRFQALEERFVREAEAGARLLFHPHLVSVLDLVSDTDKTLYLILEFVEGGTLADILMSGPLPLARALRLTADIARGLRVAHERSIVHRDIKPANIFLAEDGRAKVGDFGIAQIDDFSSYRTHATTGHPGTPLYMSPEQEHTTGFLRPASDQYSLGLVLFEMLTGQASKRIGQQEAARLRSYLPSLVRGLLGRMTAPEPDDRYPSMAAVVAEIEGIERRLSHAATAPSPSLIERATVPDPPRKAFPPMREDASAARQSAASGRDTHRTPIPRVRWYIFASAAIALLLLIASVAAVNIPRGSVTPSTPTNLPATIVAAPAPAPIPTATLTAAPTRTPAAVPTATARPTSSDVAKAAASLLPAGVSVKLVSLVDLAGDGQTEALVVAESTTLSTPPAGGTGYSQVAALLALRGGDWRLAYQSPYDKDAIRTTADIVAYPMSDKHPGFVVVDWQRHGETHTNVNPIVVLWNGGKATVVLDRGAIDGTLEVDEATGSVRFEAPVFKRNDAFCCSSYLYTTVWSWQETDLRMSEGTMKQGPYGQNGPPPAWFARNGPPLFELTRPFRSRLADAAVFARVLAPSVTVKNLDGQMCTASDQALGQAFASLVANLAVSSLWQSGDTFIVTVETKAYTSKSTPVVQAGPCKIGGLNVDGYRFSFRTVDGALRVTAIEASFDLLKDEPEDTIAIP